MSQDPIRQELKFLNTYNTILGFVPRIVGASLAACWCGEFCNCLGLEQDEVPGWR